MRIDEERRTKEILLGRVVKVITLVMFGIVIANASVTLYSTYRNTMDSVDGIVLSNIQYFQLEDHILKTEEAQFYPVVYKVFDAFEKAYIASGEHLTKSDFAKLSKLTNKAMDFYVVSSNGIVLQSTYAKDVGLNLFNIPGIKNDLMEAKAQNKVISTPLVTSFIERTLIRYYNYPMKNGGFLEISVKHDVMSGYFGQEKELDYNKLMTQKIKYVEGVSLLDHLGRQVLSVAGNSNDVAKLKVEDLSALDNMSKLGQRHVVHNGLKMTILEPINLKAGKTASVDNRYIQVDLDFKYLVNQVLMYVILQILLLLGVIRVAYQATDRFFVKILSELDEARKKGILTEKVDLFGAMISKVGHELNTPLGVITTVMSYLKIQVVKLTSKIEQMGNQDDMDVLEDIHESIKLMDSSMGTTKEIVLKFQTLLRTNLEYELQQVNIVTILRRIVTDYKAEFEHNQIRVHLEGDESIAFLTNEKAVVTMFTNLFDNVIQHGSLSTKETEVFVKVWRSKGCIYIRFEDNGKGVSQDKLDQLFIPFYTTKAIKSNVGLGLSFVYNYVVETMCGRIDSYHGKNQVGFGILIEIPDHLK